MPTHQPTREQQAIVQAALTGNNLVVTAGAGTGKTSTMELAARAMPDRRGLYAAYNKAAQLDAARRMPRTLECKTSSALARLFVIQQWGARVWDERMNKPRQSGWEQSRILGIKGPHRISPDRVLAPTQVARIVMGTVERFTFSADQKVEAWHVPQQNGVDTSDEKKALADMVLPIARRAWDNVSKPNGEIKLSFDHAMKMWQLSDVVALPYDYIILDEAQDTNPSWGSILSRQVCQLIVVGDSNQALYGWRGAADAMPIFAATASHVLQLSQSFRFGPAIAEEANKWLGLLNSDLRLTGHHPIQSTVGPCPNADAVLCRTNAEAMTNVMRYQQAGVPVALVGGGGAMRRMAEACIDLREKGETWHPDLCAFSSWGAVQDYVADDHGGGDLAVFVSLIDEYGAEAVIAAANKTVDEDKAQVVVSTAHKSKGREWDRVRIADDFPEPSKDKNGDVPLPTEASMMLAYVAVTRAQQRLDRSGLDWVDRYLGAGRAVA